MIRWLFRGMLARERAVGHREAVEQILLLPEKVYLNCTLEADFGEGPGMVRDCSFIGGDPAIHVVGNVMRGIDEARRNVN